MKYDTKGLSVPCVRAQHTDHSVTAFPLVLFLGVSTMAQAPPRDSNSVSIMILYYIYVCLAVYVAIYLSVY